MKTAALVPFKCFTRAKRRLRSRYTDEQVEQLGRAMLCDVIDALRSAHGVDDVRVLTDDQAVAEVAMGAGAGVRLRQPDPGLNEAIDAAAGELKAEGFDACLIALGDLPLLTGAEVERVIETGHGQALVIAPAEDGGTALLLRRPPLCIAACFGPGSAEAHFAAARAHGREAAVIELAHGMALDLDTPEDAEKLLQSPQACRTRDLLRSWVS